MDELEKTMPDDFWRKAFDDAAETPPPRVWDAIEHRLDKSDGARIVPLWATGLVSSKPVAWTMGIAASVALVLVGWWLLSTPSNTQSVMVAHQIPSNVQNEGLQSGSVNTSSNGAHPSTEESVAATEPVNRATTPVTAEQRTSTKPTIQPNRSIANANWATAQKSLVTHHMAIASMTHQPVSMLVKTDLPSSGNERFASASFINTGYLVTNSSSDQAINRAVFEPVTGRGPIYSSRFGQINRIVWFQPTESSVAPEAVKAKRKSRDIWASASVMSGTYNPMVSIHTTSIIANNYNYAALDATKTNQLNSNAQQSISSRPNFSMAYQASAGVQLNDHWSVESGVGYLAGRSTIETPAQIAIASFTSSIARTSSTNTLYTDIVRNSISADQTQSLSMTPAAYNSTAYVGNQTAYSAQTRQTITNDYQFVQVPVQIGYQLRPRKRLSLALLGGFITNIFVRNTIGDELVVTPKDGIYKPVTLAATMGARFRYRPSRQWSASFAGIYQPSLGLGTSSESQVQTHPSAAGMSFGVDYHF